MHIVHFDIDSHIHPFLSGTLVSTSLHEYKENKSTDIECVTIKTLSHATAEVLARFPRLRLIVTRTVGTDHIDLDYCKSHNIAVYHIVDYGSFNIAEHTFALLLAGCRNIVSSQKEIKSGTFSYSNHLGISLKGKTMGVVGTGRIGYEVITRALAFEMKVVAYDVVKNPAVELLHIPYLTLEELARESDIITLHAPLLPSTTHMIDGPLIATMKEGVVLINTARGGLIDESALIDNVSKFSFIGLDVLEHEDKFDSCHPLLRVPHVVITPHIAFFSDASVKKIATETMRMIENFENGNAEGKVA